MTLYSEMLLISVDGWAASLAARSAAAAASRAARAAARSNAAGASRAARSAASRSARSNATAAARAARSAAAATAEAARGAASIRGFDYPEEEEERRRGILTSTLPPRAPRDLVPGAVDVTYKDLESDEVTWALYEQWRTAYSKVRGRSEMARRFHRFKSTAASVLSAANETACEGMPVDFVSRLGPYADGYGAEDIVELKRIAAARGDPYLISPMDSIAVDVDPSADQSPAGRL